MSSSSRRNTKWIILAVAIIIIVVLFAAYIAFIMPRIDKPKEVTLTGTVTTTGTGTNPEKITFKSMRDEKTYVAGVSGGGNPGTYSIVLPNGDSYKVSITWKFFGITGGTADAGTLNLDTSATSIERNWAG
jgi:hypothetical protein